MTSESNSTIESNHENCDCDSNISKEAIAAPFSVSGNWGPRCNFDEDLIYLMHKQMAQSKRYFRNDVNGALQKTQSHRIHLDPTFSFSILYGWQVTFTNQWSYTHRYQESAEVINGPKEQ